MNAENEKGVTRRFGTRPDEKGSSALSGHEAAVWSIAFSPGQTEFLSTSKDGKAFVWNMATGKIETTLAGHTDGVCRGVYSESFPHTVLTCSLDSTARLWDLRMRNDESKICSETTIFRDHAATVWSASFGNEAYSMATASHDMTAKVYDLRVRLPRSILAGHTGLLWQARLLRRRSMVGNLF